MTTVDMSTDAGRHLRVVGLTTRETILADRLLEELRRRPRPSSFAAGRDERRRRRRLARRPVEPGEPTPLPESYRLAQIDEALERGWSRWEIAQLVPGPVSAAERARVVH